VFTYRAYLEGSSTAAMLIAEPLVPASVDGNPNGLGGGVPMPTEVAGIALAGAAGTGTANA
jgi:hypothetical protein